MADSSAFVFSFIYTNYNCAELEYNHGYLGAIVWNRHYFTAKGLRDDIRL